MSITSNYYHVDVFSSQPYSGNGLTVFPDSTSLSTETMQQVTKEMRQFESIFLSALSGNKVSARVFTMEEELDFAGHPVLGAASILHELHRPDEVQADWLFELPAKTVAVHTQRKGQQYTATMNQGKAIFGNSLDIALTEKFLGHLHLTMDDKHPDIPLKVVSTGLPYLLIPVIKNILQARILIADLEDQLATIGAKFIGVVDIPNLQIRTWDNKGLVEDIATGSLAGPAGALLVRYGQQPAGGTILLRQGAHLGRPSELKVVVQETGDIIVSGDVCKVATGSLLTTPA